MLILRPAAAGDLDDLLRLARELDTVNLPEDPGFLAERVAVSERAFAGELPDPEEAVYVFVLEDLEARRCVGTSMILAKQGRRGLPYYWLEVSTEERASPELERRFVHRKLTLRSTEDGPTEIGGLVLEPGYRRHAARCGKALSVVRFAWISMHPERFELQVIAEMLSPFEDTGRNLLWDAFGARFTGLPYREADHLSARTKQWIADLFPRDPVYVTLFPKDVQEVIGKPNDTARAAVRILEKVGFHPLNQVDPFDGGPYYGAARDAIVSVRERRVLVLPGESASEAEGAPEHAQGERLALLATEKGRPFRATVVPLGADDAPQVSAASREALGVAGGDRVSITPLP